ncbi:MAG: metallophosphoesterase [Colwellia sp.]|nr:metallophosphoesterase [Colwellia sp.]
MINKISTLFTLLFFCLISSVELFADQGESSLIISDGPYVMVNSNELEVNWLCENTVKQMGISSNKLPFNFEHCGLDIIIDRDKFLNDALIYQGDFKVAAASDFHGQYDLMLKLLMNNHIINDKKQWVFGNGHFVITGDVFDRGDKVTEILWFLYQLEQQAEQAGGKVHLLLGNHEVMVLNGDLRYLHPKYVETAKRLQQPFERLYGKDTLLGKWLRSKSVLVKVNDMLFAHGGFHPSLAKEKRTLAEINQVFKENLVKGELMQPRAGWGEYLHKTNGPIWYRGYFKGSRKDEGASSAEIDLLLSHFDVEHLIVGHTSQKQVETRHQGRVIAIDSSIKDGKYGEILLIDGNKKWRGSLSGEKLAL